LPVDAEPSLRRVQLVAPTSTDQRIALAAERTDGWLYLVTVTGTTGAREDVSPALGQLVERARSLTDLPLYAGFGISTPEQAAGAQARETPPRHDASGWRPSAAPAPPRAARTGRPECPTCGCRRR